MRALFLASALLLSACGFTPLHGTAAGQQTFNQIGVTVGDGQDENDRAAGFLLRQRLADRLDAPAEPRYLLDVEPRVRQIGLGLTGQDRASRFDSSMEARWELRDAATGELVEKGRTRGTATFSADRDPYRLLSTNEAAVQRVSAQIADDILASVALALAETPSP